MLDEEAEQEWLVCLKSGTFLFCVSLNSWHASLGNLSGLSWPHPKWVQMVVYLFIGRILVTPRQCSEIKMLYRLWLPKCTPSLDLLKTKRQSSQHSFVLDLNRDRWSNLLFSTKKRTIKSFHMNQQEPTSINSIKGAIGSWTFGRGVNDLHIQLWQMNPKRNWKFLRNIPWNSCPLVMWMGRTRSQRREARELEFLGVLNSSAWKLMIVYVYRYIYIFIDFTFATTMINYA